MQRNFSCNPPARSLFRFVESHRNLFLNEHNRINIITIEHNSLGYENTRASYARRQVDTKVPKARVQHMHKNMETVRM